MDSTVSATNLELAASTSGAAPQGDDHSSRFGRFEEHFTGSLKYSLIQVPVNAITQIYDHTANTNHLPQVQMFEQPKKGEVGSAEWLGDVCGNTAAAAIPLIVFHKFTGPGAATSIEILPSAAFKKAAVTASLEAAKAAGVEATEAASLNATATYGVKAAWPALTKTAALGAFYGGVLTPSDNTKDNFWLQRGENALSSSIALTTMTAGSIGLKATGKAVLANDMVSSGLSGGVAGAIDANAHSLLKGNGFASKQELYESVAAWSVGSALGGAANTAHEFINPSTGMRGVRTLQDMIDLADSTIKPGHPKRYEFEGQQANPVKAELLSDAALHEWYNRSSLNLRHEIDNSGMPVEWKKQIVSGHQDFTYALDALANRPNPKPIAVVYGSARFKETDFRYQRARYIGGRLVQEGYDVMTGGGPGTMEAVNRGAYEAGGTSIGVVLKLPHEKRGNGYQTLTLKHRNFYTRMENLKKADVFIAEDGGIGTGAEILDTLTHIQCGKLKEVPTYAIGKKFYGFMDKWLSFMQKGATISPGDRNLYMILGDPEVMFTDLNAKKVAEAKAQQAATDAAPKPGVPTA